MLSFRYTVYKSFFQVCLVGMQSIVEWLFIFTKIPSGIPDNRCIKYNLPVSCSQSKTVEILKGDRQRRKRVEINEIPHQDFKDFHCSIQLWFHLPILQIPILWWSNTHYMLIQISVNNTESTFLVKIMFFY